MATSKNIVVSKSARYYLLGEYSEKINSVWFVLHGYGQLAEKFITYFKPVINETTMVIAPEALNRFYLKGFSGNVGATWMTKEGREEEINDYVSYLDSVYDEVIKYGITRNAKVIVLGFSQGTATACRWTTKGKSKIDRLILWGGGIPPDIDLKHHNGLFNSINLEIVIGSEDEFIPEEQVENEIKRLQEIKLNYKIHRFNGKHELKANILRQLIQH
ncbi:MAG: dienelactone hydrolase family protein [Ignavibacteriales bacterium]|nr:dienelactone hydrolase family protein [Ignavibacteriales bacterium]